MEHQELSQIDDIGSDDGREIPLSLGEFQDEIAALKLEEDTLHKTGHFKGDFNEKELTLEDMDMWSLYRQADAEEVSGDELLEKFNAYRKKVSETSYDESSRTKFCAFIANKITLIVTKWQLANRSLKK